MPALLEDCQRPLSIHGVTAISSQQLAEDLSKLFLRSEGFAVEDYLTLDGPYLVEFIDGRIQVLPMPDAVHQFLAFWIQTLLYQWTLKHDPEARAVGAPFFVFVREAQYREPDVCLMLGKNAARRSRKQWRSADLVVEIVSPSNRSHDLETKRREYAINGIPEYWIVDPEMRTLTVLTLNGTEYAEHGVFIAGQTATSVLLLGISLDVGAMFAEAERQAD